MNCDDNITKPPEEPEIKLISPTNNEILVDSVEVEITATDNKGITQVDLIVDNEIVKTWIISPYIYMLDLTSYSDSSIHQIYARAYDADGNISTTPIISVSVRLLSSPTSLSADIISDTQIRLNWQDNSNIESGFLIERRIEDEFYCKLAEVNANITCFVDSGIIYGNNYYYRVRAFTTSHNSAYTNEVFFLSSDNDVYTTVKIGDQFWMVENLKVTHYRNGDNIPLVTDNEQWDRTTGAYCDYNNNTTISDIYGYLYNWYAVNDSRNIAPLGWHIPSDSEWQILIDYLGGDDVAGNKMKEIGISHWNPTNTGATNESGFTALPGGLREASGSFHYQGYTGYWWSSTSNDTKSAWGRDMNCNQSQVSRSTFSSQSKKYGYSVRCVKD